MDITIAPEARNAGIGAHVLDELIEESGRSGLPISIYVENFNPSRRLFERLGFRVASQDGFMLFLWRDAKTADEPAARPEGG